MTALPALPDHPPAADRVIALSEGAANIAEGEWPERRYNRVTRAELHEYKIETPRGRALVYGGGGYVNLVADREGIEIALWLNALGLDAYVLVHRLPGTDDGPGDIHPHDIALQDGMTALDHLATLDALPLLHVGLSSGGHLAGVMACQPHELTAKGVLIAYAPVNANHKDYKAPAGKPDFPPVQKQDFYNAWPVGIAAEPHGVPQIPVFLAYALHDKIVPIDHALNFIRTAQQTGADLEAHIFPQAPHGFALRELDGTHDQWPALAARWFDKVLG
ncbi:prolyl oligopeptidase family serine peptidase [Asticcacaulis sp. BYS171W]|uniref:Prolyl oligopeptidase family serine peptidase n=1 Tax=Asticcacaulis aquaticus TaxID=2984212 RepID=A0ABT5HS04_9CAUL|nr:prolyl oligopeptidase family serine peptidase [Asticcacaulis aquaticus]MDC7682718.1 prolyl oligopeptidase family serine peptidase [Asticcacaulis aquaticus]